MPETNLCQEPMPEGRRAVPVYTNLVSADAPMEDRVAVKLWNLKFAAADALSGEAAKICTSEFPDGKKTLADRTLYVSLRRLKIPYQIQESGGSPYLVLAGSALKLDKAPRPDRIVFEGG